MSSSPMPSTNPHSDVRNVNDGAESTAETKEDQVQSNLSLQVPNLSPAKKQPQQEPKTPSGAIVKSARSAAAHRMSLGSLACESIEEVEEEFSDGDYSGYATPVSVATDPQSSSPPREPVIVPSLQSTSPQQGTTTATITTGKVSPTVDAAVVAALKNATPSTVRKKASEASASAKPGTSNRIVAFAASPTLKIFEQHDEVGGASPLYDGSEAGMYGDFILSDHEEDANDDDDDEDDDEDDELLQYGRNVDTTLANQSAVPVEQGVNEEDDEDEEEGDSMPRNQERGVTTIKHVRNFLSKSQCHALLEQQRQRQRQQQLLSAKSPVVVLIEADNDMLVEEGVDGVGGLIEEEDDGDDGDAEGDETVTNFAMMTTEAAADDRDELDDDDLDDGDTDIGMMNRVEILPAEDYDEEEDEAAAILSSDGAATAADGEEKGADAGPSASAAGGEDVPGTNKDVKKERGGRQRKPRGGRNSLSLRFPPPMMLARGASSARSVSSANSTGTGGARVRNERATRTNFRWERGRNKDQHAGNNDNIATEDANSAGNPNQPVSHSPSRADQRKQQRQHRRTKSTPDGAGSPPMTGRVLKRFGGGGGDKGAETPGGSSSPAAASRTRKRFGGDRSGADHSHLQRKKQPLDSNKKNENDVRTNNEEDVVVSSPVAGQIQAIMTEEKPWRRPLSRRAARSNKNNKKGAASATSEDSVPANNVSSENVKMAETEVNEPSNTNVSSTDVDLSAMNSQTPMASTEPNNPPTPTTSGGRPLLRYIRNWGKGGQQQQHHQQTQEQQAAGGDLSEGSFNEDQQMAGGFAVDDETLSPITSRATIAASNRGGLSATPDIQSSEGAAGVAAAADSTSEDDNSMIADDEEDFLDEDASFDSWDSASLEDRRRRCEGDIEWADMPMLPIRFLSNAPPISTATATPSSPTGAESSVKPPRNPYLDNSLLNSIGTLSQRDSNRFVWEHGLLLQAVLQLLTERDQVGVEGSTDSIDNIWKKGPLKKRKTSRNRIHQYSSSAAAAAAVATSTLSSKWKVKYVELRRGNICYYEDSGHSSAGRKTIHLRQADTIVRECQGSNSGNNTGFVFEIAVQGSPTRYWMASSEEERQAWIRAIQAAMIGGEDTRRELDLAPHHEALTIYTTLRNKLQSTDLTEEYIRAIHSAMQHAATLQVPFQWIRDQMVRTADVRTPAIHEPAKRAKFNKSPHKRLMMSITEFWKSLGNTSFAINGIALPRASPLAAERIIGSLTRSILEFDKAANMEDEEAGSGVISELQAVSYARSILMTVLRSKEEQDSTCTVNHLLQNPDLVVINAEPDEEETVHMEVSFAEEVVPDDLPQVDTELSGWLRTRRKHTPTSQWRRRFAVLSGGVISYYEAATPRPHGLRGQVVLNGACMQKEETISFSETRNRFALCISTPDQERLLSFEREEELEEWKRAIQKAIDSCVGAVSPEALTSPPPTEAKQKSSLLKGANRVIMGAIPDGSIRGGMRAIKGAAGGGIKAIKDATGGGVKAIRGAVGMLHRKTNEHSDQQQAAAAVRGLQRPSIQMLMSSSSPAITGKREPTVQCVTQATRTFHIMERCDLEGGIPARLLSVRAKIFQAFLMSGGSSGRIARGDALVELDFFGACIPYEVDDGEEDDFDDDKGLTN